jgi:hypothetical protein
VTTRERVVSSSSGQVQIPPGSYQVIVNNDIPDINDTDHMFHFSGPGVILLTDMGAGDNKTEAYTETLTPNATYVFQDDRQPGIGRIVIGTAATASGTGSTSSRPTSRSPAPAASSNTGSKTTANSSILAGGSSAPATPSAAR